MNYLRDLLMVRELVKTVSMRMGYQISRYQPRGDAFSEMRRLCVTANPVIFDVGAYHGQVALCFRKLWPEALIYAFEPFPKSYERLVDNTSEDPGIRAFSFGLSDVAGIQPFSANASSVTNSLLETDERAAGAWGPLGAWHKTVARINLEFQSIDDFVQEQSISSIDILKLDVQGAEYRVLNGAERMIAEDRVKLIYSEIITVPSYRGQKRFDEVLRMFRDYGFSLHNIYNLALVDGRLCQVDAIFTL